MKLSLNDIRLRDKMMLMYFLSVFLPIMVTNMIFYNVATRNVKEQRIQDITLTLEQVKNDFSREVEDALEISSVFITDYMLNEILEASYEHPGDYVAAYDSYVRRILNPNSTIYNSVESIEVYTNNPTLIFSGGINLIDEEVKAEPWYNAATGEDNQGHPVIMRTGSGDRLDKFSVVRRMNYFYVPNDRMKILKIDMRMSAINHIFGNMNLKGSMYLLNEHGEVIYTTNPEVDVSRTAVTYASLPPRENQLEFRSGIFETNNMNSWEVVAAVSEDAVNLEVRESGKFVMLLTALNIVLPSLIIIWISRSMSNRLSRVLKHMKKVKNQHYDTIPEGESRDEIGQLTGEFNRMTRELKSLINDVYVADIQRKNLEIQSRHAQLNALQSQINPHFLFNALETIRMRSLMKDEDETARIIHNMAKLFRNSLVWKRDMVTLKEEIDFVHCFLEIQKYRFGDKISYKVHTPESEADSLIPKMSIVTFVENACIHGLEPLKQGGRIEVEVMREGGALICLIRDNGVGMTADKVERLYSYISMEEQMGERIGIQNVIYRLKMYYEDRFDLKIDSEPGSGTVIQLSIPAEGSQR